MSNTSIYFRNKFLKLIESDQTEQAFTSACEKFCTLSEAAAMAILWRLSYNTITPTEDLRQLGLNPEEISIEIIASLRNELRYQYQKNHPNCWEVDLPEDCVESFTNLKNHTDLIVATVVYNRCVSHTYMEEEAIQRVFFLLKSDLENNYFGGLRELHFPYDQANYLKPFHMQVHNLFVAVYEHFKQQVGSGDFNNKPFEGLAERLNQAAVNLSDDDLPFEISTPTSDKGNNEVQPELPVEAPVEAPAQTSATKFTALTVENIMAHKEVFTSFADNNFSSLEQIKDLGFDLNGIIGHGKAIARLLIAAESLAEAQHNLDIAAKAFST